MHNRKKSTTCICAIKDRKGRISIAADRRATWSFSKAQEMDRPKVVKKDNGVILAGTGNGGLCHLVVDILDLPPIPTNMSSDEYAHGILYSRIKSLLEKKGYVDEHKILKIPTDSFCEVVVAISGNCYTVTIFNPDELNHNPNGLIDIDSVSLPYTTGCGAEHAKGAIDALHLLNVKDIKMLLTLAIKVAAQNSPGCDDNIDIVRED